jgi:hypothetical protein
MGWFRRGLTLAWAILGLGWPGSVLPCVFAGLGMRWTENDLGWHGLGWTAQVLACAGLAGDRVGLGWRWPGMACACLGQQLAMP